VRSEVGQYLREVRLALGDRDGVAVGPGTDRTEQGQSGQVAVGGEPHVDVGIEARVGFLELTADLGRDSRGQNAQVFGCRGAVAQVLLVQSVQHRSGWLVEGFVRTVAGQCVFGA
jgi:hypothetical protein